MSLIEDAERSAVSNAGSTAELLRETPAQSALLEERSPFKRRSAVVSQRSRDPIDPVARP